MHIVNFPPIMNSNNHVFMLLRGLEMHFLDMALLIRKLSEPRFMKDIDIVYIIQEATKIRNTQIIGIKQTCQYLVIAKAKSLRNPFE